MMYCYVLNERIIRYELLVLHVIFVVMITVYELWRILNEQIVSINIFRCRTYNMLKDGLTINEIATKRELVEGTIQSHLAHYIKDGKLNLSDILGIKKANNLIYEIKQTKFENITELKAKLNDKYSYGELRMAMYAIEK